MDVEEESMSMPKNMTEAEIDEEAARNEMLNSRLAGNFEAD